MTDTPGKADSVRDPDDYGPEGDATDLLREQNLERFGHG